MSKAQTTASPVPRSRFERLAHLGGLAGRVAGGMLAEGMRQVARGNLPRAADLVLTPANARRVTEKLSELRGAAMKVGQLLSMDAGDILPAELAAILARLRADARPMPMSEMVTVMQAVFRPGVGTPLQALLVYANGGGIHRTGACGAIAKRPAAGAEDSVSRYRSEYRQRCG